MLRAGHLVIASALALLVLGVVMVNSAGMQVGKAAVTPSSVLLGKTTVYMLMALGTMLLVAWLAPTRLVAKPPAIVLPREDRSGWTLWGMWAIVVITIGLLAVVYLPGVGSERKGSHRWVKLFISDLTIQPSELAKWILVGLIAWYAVAMRERIRSLFGGLLPVLVACGAIAGFVAIEDLGTAILLLCVTGVLLLAAGARPWHFMLPLPFAAAALYAAVKLQPYRMKRITAFLDPYAEPQTTGYHMIQSMVAISNGQTTGRGLGNGLQKLDYLPEDTTDFIFAIICEELGLIGAATVVTLFCVLLLAGLAIVFKQRTTQAKLLALGIVSTIGIQTVINLFVVVGWGPTKGIALPLLSSGGTGWILTAGALGLLVALDRHATAERLLDRDIGPEVTDEAIAAELASRVAVGAAVTTASEGPSDEQGQAGGQQASLAAGHLSSAGRFAVAG